MSRESPDTRRLAEPGLLAVRRDRGARLGFSGGADFLHRAVAEALAERLAAVTRPFDDAVLVGSGGGVHAAALAGRVGQGGLRQIEISPMRARAAGAELAAGLDTLPLAPGCCDLAVSALEMHWLDDPVGHLIQLRRALRPDGLMIAALFGGQTLAELRASLAEAEVATTGGLSPRVAPMADVRALGGLMQRAGFAMPVADVERYEASYPDARALMRELRAMGETNILAERRRAPLGRDTLARAEALYRENFPAGAGRIKATFEIVFLTGWAPAEGQPRPLRPGSARARLAEALGATERSAGEKAGPGRRGR